MTKSQQYFHDMMENHKEIFDEFKKIHDDYVKDTKAFQETFNEKGQEVLRIVRRYENMLCGKSESGRYGKYSTGLSEKFWEPIRAVFPKIDFIGVKQ